MDKIVVDQNLCIGCGMCYQNFPEYFEMNEDMLSVVKKEKITSEEKKEVIEAIEMCPVEAIVIE